MTGFTMFNGQVKYSKGIIVNARQEDGKYVNKNNIL